MSNFLSEHDAASYSPLSLAFLGDSVYDTFVREYLLRQANVPPAKLHSEKVRLVCAEFQSSVYEIVAAELDEKELAVLKRGRNAVGGNVPRHAGTVRYRRATALECLFGYLYLAGRTDRLYRLFEIIKLNFPENTSTKPCEDKL